MPGHPWKIYQLSPPRVDNLNPDQDDDAGAQPVDMHVGDSSRLQQLIIRPGESGGVAGVLTRSEFEM
jgi:hypothetical protein